MNSLSGVLFGWCIFLGPPGLRIWGWIRWFKQRDFQQFCSCVALIAFICSILFGSLTFVSAVYVQSAHLTAYDIRGHGYSEPVCYSLRRLCFCRCSESGGIVRSGGMHLPVQSECCSFGS